MEDCPAIAQDIRREATLVFPLRGNPPSEILLGFKKNGFGSGKLNGFGGKVEPNESVESAAARELKEECSIQVDVANLHRVAHLDFVFPAKPGWNQVVHAFVAFEWRGEPTETREMKPIWFRTNAIPYDRMWQDDRQWIPHALAGKLVEAKFTFKEDNETVEAAEVTVLLDTG